jgi:hypothetical protein
MAGEEGHKQPEPKDLEGRLAELELRIKLIELTNAVKQLTDSVQRISQGGVFPAEGGGCSMPPYRLEGGGCSIPCRACGGYGGPGCYACRTC